MLMYVLVYFQSNQYDGIAYYFLKKLFLTTSLPFLVLVGRGLFPGRPSLSSVVLCWLGTVVLPPLGGLKGHSCPVN